MILPQQLSINDFNYVLPEEKIARYPLPERDVSKLLVYNKGLLQEDIYRNLHQYLPENSLLIFNNTKVIKARIIFTKPSGGEIEIFLLEPFQADYTATLSASKKTAWKCMIGGASKWKEGDLQLKIKNVELKIVLKEKLSDAYVVEFSWTPTDLSFAEVLEKAGDIPLPPYIKRKTEAADTERYQTIYAHDEGSVAAPTAGLHFTKAIFKSFTDKKIQTGFVTLHVGAGTFKPVKAATMQGHEMHAEWIDVPAEMIENLIAQLNKPIVAIGTTSLRTLESLYWMGVKTNLQPAIKHLLIDQWEVYEAPLVNCNISAQEALSSLLTWLKENNQHRLFTQSQILIAPGYTFKIANAIITNFHQPQSTLLLLVAAAIGDGWKAVYKYALENDFRFLSYGDGSLLFINNE